MSLRSTMLESYGALYRPTISRDARQGTVQDPFKTVALATNLPCSVQQASGHIKALYKQQQMEAPTSIYFDQDPQCQANDYFLATDRTGAQTYYQLHGRAMPVGRGRTWTVEATWLQEPA